LQTQTPPEHSCPAPQAAPLPHAQSPMAEQLSALPGAHATQPSPPKPHAESDRALHVGPEQQPVEHVAAHPLHVPRVQLSPPGQLWHDVPPLPQAPTLSPDWQVPDAQHPVGHDTPSHTQAPLKHRWPAEHAAPIPQPQTPEVEQLSVSSGSHAPQVAPGAPHAEREMGVHVVPSQQPSGHDVASHLQEPDVQCCPGLHAAAAPQRHAPAAQLSDSTGLHGKHDAPPVPQFAAEGVLHVVPLQQPLAQDVASHTQRPPTQCCPPAHAGLPPQVHFPAAEQASAVEAVHWTHAAAPLPQDAKEDGAQVIPLQQPSGHAQPPQAPPVQVSPAAQAEQASPALPQAVGTLPGWQAPSEQQPLGHEVASHVHEPAMHLCPAPHAGSAPQRQSPLAEHESLVVALHAVHTQATPLHSCPGAQGGPLPHEGPVWL
jgi:hypothetical protein